MTVRAGERLIPSEINEPAAKIRRKSEYVMSSKMYINGDDSSANVTIALNKQEIVSMILVGYRLNGDIVNYEDNGSGYPDILDWVHIYDVNDTDFYAVPNVSYHYKTHEVFKEDGSIDTYEAYVTMVEWDLTGITGEFVTFSSPDYKGTKQYISDVYFVTPGVSLGTLLPAIYNETVPSVLGFVKSALSDANPLVDNRSFSFSGQNTIMFDTGIIPSTSTKEDMLIMRFASASSLVALIIGDATIGNEFPFTLFDISTDTYYVSGDTLTLSPYSSSGKYYWFEVALCMKYSNNAQFRIAASPSATDISSILFGNVITRVWLGFSNVINNYQGTLTVPSLGGYPATYSTDNPITNFVVSDLNKASKRVFYHDTYSPNSVKVPESTSPEISLGYNYAPAYIMAANDDIVNPMISTTNFKIDLQFTAN